MPVAVIQLRNAKAFSFSLYHDQYCEKAGACGCTVTSAMRPVHNAKTGEYGQRHEKIVNPRSVYLPDHGEIQLHPAVIRLPQIANAIRQGLIEVKVIES